jgi:hypothetical protein
LFGANPNANTKKSSGLTKISIEAYLQC